MSEGVDPRDSVLSYLTVQGATAVETVEAAASSGFGGVTIRVVPVGAAAASKDAVISLATPTETLAAAKAAGVAIVDVEFVNLTPDWRIEDWATVVEVGAEVGASCVNAMGTDPDHLRLGENFAQLSEFADERGLFAALEFSAYSAVRSLGEAQGILASADAPGAAIVVDALHLTRSGGTPDAVAQAAVADPGLYRCLHLCDAVGVAPDSPAGLAEESRTNRLLPGDGELPLAGLLAALPEARRYVEAPVLAQAEAPPRERAAAAAASLRRLEAQDRAAR